MLDSAIKSSGLEGIFEPSLSTDRVRVYKPDPRAYQMGIGAFNLRREEILFAALGGWDAAGAKLFGYPNFLGKSLESPDGGIGCCAQRNRPKSDRSGGFCEGPTAVIRLARISLHFSLRFVLAVSSA
jgi:2-haloacid dehalogenase